jgi:hypothetical protein
MAYLATYQTEIRHMIGFLQQWQMLLSPCCEQAAVVTLADVEAVTASLQETFGALTPLETIIQQLVVADLCEQIDRELRCLSDCSRAVA